MQQTTVAIDKDLLEKLLSMRLPGEASYQDVVKRLLEKELKESIYAQK